MRNLERAAADHERFQRLYEALQPAVLGYALRRTPSPADAWDVCAETFLVAWRRLEDIPDDDRTVVWLYGVARRVLANSHRGAQRRTRLVEKLEAQQPPLDRDDIGAVDRRQEVLAALATLSADDQEVLTLAAWEGLSHAQLGAFLGCSGNAATVRLHRARKRLALALGKGTGGDRAGAP